MNCRHKLAWNLWNLFSFRKMQQYIIRLFPIKFTKENSFCAEESWTFQSVVNHAHNVNLTFEPWWYRPRRHLCSRRQKSCSRWRSFAGCNADSPDDPRIGLDRSGSSRTVRQQSPVLRITAAPSLSTFRKQCSPHRLDRRITSAQVRREGTEENERARETRLVSCPR